MSPEGFGSSKTLGPIIHSRPNEDKILEKLKYIATYHYINHISPTHQRPQVWVAGSAVQRIKVNVIENSRNTRRTAYSNIYMIAEISRYLTAGIAFVRAIISSIKVMRILSHTAKDDIVIVCNGGIESVTILIGLKILHRKAAIDFVDFTPRSNRMELLSRGRAVLERIAMKLTEKAIFVSEEQRRRAIAAGMIEPSKTLWIPYGMTDSAVESADIIRRRSVALRNTNVEAGDGNYPMSDCLLLGWFGSLFVHDGVEANGIGEIVTVLDLLKTKLVINVRLVLAGVDKNQFIDIVKPRYPSMRYVECTGPFEWGTVEHWELLLSCDILLLPAGPDLIEANRAKVYDYMAAGRPIIARDTAEMRRVLEKNAVYVDGSEEQWMSAIEKLANDSRYRNYIGEQARNRLMTKFTSKQLASKMVLINSIR